MRTSSTKRRYSVVLSAAPAWKSEALGVSRRSRARKRPARSFARPNHLAERDRIVKAEIDAGWKPYFRRTNGAVGPSPAAPFNQPRLATLASDETPLERNAEGNGRLLLIGFDAHERLRAMSSGTFKEFRFVELDRTIRKRPDFEPNADFPSDLEDPAWDSVAETFDSIVCDRAIEHCREPLRLLQRLRRLLSPNGRLSLRFANVRRHELVHALIRGSWAGGNGARPDRRPIQFFTRREVEKLLFRAGFQTCSISIVPGPEHEQWQSQGRSGRCIRDQSTPIGTEAKTLKNFMFMNTLSRRPQPKSLTRA